MTPAERRHVSTTMRPKEITRLCRKCLVINLIFRQRRFLAISLASSEDRGFNTAEAGWECGVGSLLLLFEDKEFLPIKTLKKNYN